ncbi:MAG TPA: ABC transporter permease subunit, partial [Candidatus Limnocylindrales bacterium]
MSRRGAGWSLLLAGPPLLFVLVFFGWPVAAIIAAGLAPGGALDLAPLLETLGAPFVREVAWFTLWQAVVSTLLTVVLALPGAYAFARFDFPAKRLLGALAIVPFVLPTVVVAAAFLALLGPRSPLVHSIWVILAAHVFYNYAIVLRLVGGAWAQLDPRLVDAARMLGASRWRAFREVTWPLLRPAVASASSIVFLFTFTSFGVILLLGGPRFATLEVEIYRQVAQLLDLPAAAALALLQMAALLALLLAYARTQERLAVSLRPVA